MPYHERKALPFRMVLDKLLQREEGPSVRFRRGIIRLTCEHGIDRFIGNFRHEIDILAHREQIDRAHALKFALIEEISEERCAHRVSFNEGQHLLPAVDDDLIFEHRCPEGNIIVIGCGRDVV